MKNIVLHTFREVNRIIPAASRKKQVWIMVLLFVNSIFDIIGLSSLFPLITVVLEENIQDNYFMLLFQDMYGLETVNEFLVVLGLHIAGIVIIKNISSLLIYRQIGKYAFAHCFQLEYMRFPTETNTNATAVAAMTTTRSTAGSIKGISSHMYYFLVNYDKFTYQDR